MRRLVSIVLLLGFESGAVVVLHVLGDLPWLRLPETDAVGWVASNPPIETVAALVRPLALLAAVWVLGSTILYAAARISGEAIALSVAKFTIPAVRRLVDGALVVGVSTMIAAGPSAAVALESPLPHLVTESEDEPAARPTPAVVLERLGRTGVIDGATRDDGGVENTSREEASPDVEPAAHLVRRGDNLWSISAHHLREKVGDPGNARIARYWRKVIAENIDHLRSGDPNLIYPGEIVMLPEISE